MRQQGRQGPSSMGGCRSVVEQGCLTQNEGDHDGRQDGQGGEDQCGHHEPVRDEGDRGRRQGHFPCRHRQRIPCPIAGVKREREKAEQHDEAEEKQGSAEIARLKGQERPSRDCEARNGEQDAQSSHRHIPLPDSFLPDVKYGPCFRLVIGCGRGDPQWPWRPGSRWPRPGGVRG